MNQSNSDKYFYIYTLLHQIRHATFRIRDKEIQQFGSTSQRVAVIFIAKLLEGRATPAEIARWLFRKPNTISILTNKMAKEGLINKVHDLNRRNHVRIQVTNKGNTLYNRTLKRISINRIFSCLSDEECDKTIEYLRKIWDRCMKELGDNHHQVFPIMESIKSAKYNIFEISDKSE